jgi:primosomal protein N' (replication factor Y)
MKVANLFAEVAVFNALDKTLHYSVPEDLREQAGPGVRVLAPLGSRKAVGLILALDDTPPETPGNITFRPIIKLLDSLPVMPPELIALCRWMAHYYFYPMGGVLQTALPAGMQSLGRMHQEKKIKILRLSPPVENLEMEDGTRAQQVLSLLVQAGGSLPLRAVRRQIKNLDYWLKKLGEKGLVRIDEVEELRESNCAQTISTDDPIEDTIDQKNVIEAVLPFVAVPEFRPFLVSGVTGSGKTEVYLRLAEKALEEGKGTLVLVPEIALSTQMEALFRGRFGSRLAVWHSGLSEGARYDQWREILGGKRKVVLGVRSAVFMPVRDLALIVVDEEHDSSYKQDDHLRYHARDVALVRARMAGIPILLGSATPSLQSYHHCRTERYRLLSLPRRIHDRPMPEIEVVDMRREKGRNRVLSRRLTEALVETVKDGQQALLFLNRRGFANFMLCNICGRALECGNCSVSMTYHQRDNILRCHYCGMEKRVPEHCPTCGSSALARHGFGTERVEEEVRRVLPEARIIRIDRDTVNHSRQVAEYLNEVRNSKADILIGTQMIAKGHDFPNITLAGVVNADTSLQLPDFRSGEATVQLLMQVAGRAGRGEKSGRVILQTYNPSHYTITSVLKMDYRSFCDKELESREELRYPPYTRLSKLLITGPDEEVTRAAARGLAAICRETANRFRARNCHLAVLGPSPAPLAKLKNRYRWHIFIKAWTSQDLQELTECVLEESKSLPFGKQVHLAVDRDPTSSL